MPCRYREGMADEPCGWPVSQSCLPDVDGDDPKGQESLDAAVATAKQVLWALSGRRLGACVVQERPCPDGCGGVYSGCWCGTQCAAVGPHVVHLPGPVYRIEAVEVGGELLDDDQYEQEGDLLYRTDGEPWPDQNRTAPLSSDPHTWRVVYRKGVPVPDYAGRMVGQLANEFYQACNGGKCRLPRSVQQVTRQGISYQLVNPADIYEQGKTGLPDVDMWLSSVNPNAVMRAPVVR